MARIRKFSAYQRIERPYTRVSKYKKHSFIKARPNSVIVRFNHGNINGKFDTTLYLVSQQDVQVRHNALESARQTSNRVLEKLGKSNFFMRIRKYPFHILRENPLASGAGADRMSTGMKMSFGKPISSAAQVFVGDIVMEVSVMKEHVASAKLALQRANKKLPAKCRVVYADVYNQKAPSKKVMKAPKKEIAVKEKQEVVEKPKQEIAEKPAQEVMTKPVEQPTPMKEAAPAIVETTE